VEYLHNLIVELSFSQKPEILSRIPQILGNNPNVLLNSTLSIDPIISDISRSSDPSVRIAFLDNFVLLFARSHNNDVQQSLLTAVIRMFDRPCPKIISILTSSDIYAFFSPPKLLQIIPAFTQLISDLTSWRYIERSAETYLAFPPEVIRFSWDSISSAFLRLFVEFPHPLSRCCAGFFPRFAAALDRPLRAELTARIVRTFGDDLRWEVRMLFPAVAVGFARVPGISSQVIAFLPNFMRMLEDAVPAVVIAALTAWPSVRPLSGVAEKNILTVIAALESAPDERIRAVWMAVASEKRASSLDTLPASAGLSEMRWIRPKIVSPATVRTWAEERRGGGGSVGPLGSVARTVRRIGPSGRVVKPQWKTYAFSEVFQGRT
jgi:hypothetical protein